MEKIAVSTPSVAIKYVVDGEIKFMTKGTGQLLDAIYAVFGKDTAKRMSPVDRTDANGIRVSGYIGEPDLVRSNKNSENFFINGRFVKSRTAMAAIEQAYSTRIPHGKFPVCILNLQLNPAVVDVNVHPSKLEVKFANERVIFEAVYYAVLNTLQNTVSRPEMRLGKTDLPFYGADKTETKTTPATPKKAVNAANAFVPVERKREDNPDRIQIKLDTEAGAEKNKKNPPPAFVSAYSETNFTPSAFTNEKKRPLPTVQIKDEEKAAKAAPAPSPTPAKMTEPEKASPKAPEPLSKPEQKEEIPDYILVGEAYNCYCIIQLDDRLLVIDKHAAHERILFDELCRKMESDERSSQILMYPLKVQVREDEALALEEYRESITKIGFSYTYDEKKKDLNVTEVPAELGRDGGADMISELACVLCDSTGSIEATGAKFFEAKLYQASCKAAIKGGRVYGTDHIKWICDRLLKKPGEDGAVIKTCPHGRPVAFEIKKNSIERQFERLI